MKLNLKARVAIGVCSAMIIILAAAGIMIYLLMARSLRSEFDSALLGKARTLASLIERADIQDENSGEEESAENQSSERKPAGASRTLALDLSQDGMEEFRHSEKHEYLEVWLSGMGVIYRSPSLGRLDLGPEPSPQEAEECRPLVLPDGKPGRCVALTFVSRQLSEEVGKQARIVLLTAQDTVDIDGTLARLRFLLIGVCAGATAVSAAGLTWIVKAGLRPLNRVAGQIEALNERDLSSRLPAADAPSELKPVVNRLNDLLRRLEAAFERERAFSADVAHELRTPLSGLRATLEVALGGPGEPGAHAEALADSLQIVAQMQLMTENLLGLASLERSAAVVHAEETNVDDLLRAAWKDSEEEASARRLNVEWHVQPLKWTTDTEKMRIIMRNLFSNAVAYADERGRVRIQTEISRNMLSITVVNTGSKLTAEQAAHATERFWRGDDARSDTGVHFGLGLALCDRLAKLLDGTINVTSRAGGEFVVTLRIPAPSVKTA